MQQSNQSFSAKEWENLKSNTRQHLMYTQLQRQSDTIGALAEAIQGLCGVIEKSPKSPQIAPQSLQPAQDPTPVKDPAITGIIEVVKEITKMNTEAQKAGMQMQQTAFEQVKQSVEFGPVYADAGDDDTDDDDDADPESQGGLNAIFEDAIAQQMRQKMGQDATGKKNKAMTAEVMLHNTPEEIKKRIRNKETSIEQALNYGRTKGWPDDVVKAAYDRILKGE